MTMSTQCPMLILLVTLWSNQWARSTSGQQIFDDWDHPEEQGTPDIDLNLTVTFMNEREFNVTTRTSNGRLLPKLVRKCIDLHGDYVEK
ncbi:hypothetical protein PoB_002375400 [Plakobranchus ocellatus]|uniref:Uncharacterized protein n=1 Tax=Plakobranchus ocellatus TaxID=259542 RepID=A0AAV3ZS68_9GAST|nr:hypothetical protein PoB_002375400 [Plakobranchus ocellatus]